MVLPAAVDCCCEAFPLLRFFRGVGGWMDDVPFVDGVGVVDAVDSVDNVGIAATGSVHVGCCCCC